MEILKRPTQGIHKSNPKYIPGPTQKERLRRERKAVIYMLGDKCCKCGFSDIRALQIDHINGGGSKERKEGKFKGNFNIHVIKSIILNENKYQLLCANCNWIKRSENNEK